MQTLKIRKSNVFSGALYKGILSLLALKGSRDLKEGNMVKSGSEYHKDHIFPKSKEAEFRAGKDIDSILFIFISKLSLNFKLFRFFPLIISFTTATALSVDICFFPML